MLLCCAVLCCAVLCCAVLCCAMRRPWPSGGAHPVRRARVLTGGPQLDECLAVLRGEEAIDLEHRRIGMHQPEALVLRVHLRRHATRLAFFNRSRRAQAARGTAGMPLRDRPQQDELFVPSADVTSRGVDQARTAIWRDMSAFTPLPLASPACFFSASAAAIWTRAMWKNECERPRDPTADARPAGPDLFCARELLPCGSTGQSAETPGTGPRGLRAGSGKSCGAPADERCGLPAKGLRRAHQERKKKSSCWDAKV